MFSRGLIVGLVLGVATLLLALGRLDRYRLEREQAGMASRRMESEIMQRAQVERELKASRERLDQRVAERTAELRRINEALADEIKLSWSITSRFCNPSMAQVLPSQDVVLSVYFQTWGEFLLGDLRLMLPHESLAPLLDKFGQKKTAGPTPGAMKDKVGASVRQMPVDLAVELGATSIRCNA